MSSAAVIQEVPVAGTVPAVDVAALQDRAVKLAETYHNAGARIKVRIVERRKIRKRLIPILREIKAELVGRGCDGQWAPFCECRLKRSVRTIDNWLSGPVSDSKKKKASKLPVSAYAEQPEPTNRHELLQQTMPGMRAVFEPVLARAPEEFLAELRLYFQTAANGLVGNLDGFTVAVEFTNMSPDFSS